MRRVRQKPAGLTMRQKDFFSGLLFVSPWMIGLCVFFAFPFLNTVRLSFSQVVQMKGFQMEGGTRNTIKGRSFGRSSFCPAWEAFFWTR